MALENLKSVFTEGFKETRFVSNEDLRESVYDHMPESDYAKFQFESLGLIGQEVNAFDNEHSLGFTKYQETTQFMGVDIPDNINYDSIASFNTSYEPTSLYRINGALGTGFVDFFGGINSYKQEVDPPVPGFNEFDLFSSGGYVFPDGDLGTSKYLGINSSYTPTNEDLSIYSESTTAGSSQLTGPTSQYSLDDPSLWDLNLVAGYGYPFSNATLQVEQGGNSASLFYTLQNGQLTIGASGAFSNFGVLDDVADFFGFDIPTFDWDFPIFSQPVPTYTDTVFETAFGYTPQDPGFEVDSGGLFGRRGAAFQTIYPNPNRGRANLQYFIEGITQFSHGSRVISNWLEAGNMMTEDGFDMLYGTDGAEDFVTGTPQEANFPTLYQGINSSHPFANKSSFVGNILSGISQLQGSNYPYFTYDQDEPGFAGRGDTPFVSLGLNDQISFWEAFITGDEYLISNTIEDLLLNNLPGFGGDSLGENLTNLSNHLDEQIGGWLNNQFGDLFNTGLPNAFHTIRNNLGQLWMSSSSTDYPAFYNALGGFLGEAVSGFLPSGFGGFGNQLENLASDFINSSSAWAAIEDFGSHIDLDSYLGQGGGSWGSLLDFIPHSIPQIQQTQAMTDLLGLIRNYPSVEAINNHLSETLPSNWGPFASMQGHNQFALTAETIYMGVTSPAPQPNPRSIVNNQASRYVLPYQHLGKPSPVPSGEEAIAPTAGAGIPGKYSSNLVTKHIGGAANASISENFAALQNQVEDGTTSADYYPHTLGHTGLAADEKTLAPVLGGSSLDEAGTNGGNAHYREVAEGEKYGLPFYFKDLREDKYIIFRGYLHDINQDITPEWTEHTYLGRSEPVYVYSRARRSINFSFEVMANTRAELQTIYEKLNYLQSLTYPKYHADNYRNRMVPPLASLRIGELFGNTNHNLGGYIESLTYNWPAGSSWEFQAGKRVPKRCVISVAYKVIHQAPPSTDTLATEFLGVHN